MLGEQKKTITTTKRAMETERERRSQLVYPKLASSFTFFSGSGE